MSNRQDEIRRAIVEASHVLHDNPLGVRTGFDIIQAVRSLDIPVIFTKLDGLLGAAVTVGTMRGIMITTERPLHIQRFTLAHELGHILLGHQDSFDKDIGFAGRFSGTDRRTQEAAADTFASELLGAKSVMLPLARSRGWTRERLYRTPEVIYQLSIRLGISFVATCWSLVATGALEAATCRGLVKTEVKALKQKLDPEGLLTDSWADMWTLTSFDSGSLLEAGLNDVFAISVSDQASAGYFWQLVDQPAACEVVSSTTQMSDTHLYGDPSIRTIFVRFHESGYHRLMFEHRRPWSNATLETIDIQIDNYGKETAGEPRRHRAAALRAA